MFTAKPGKTYEIHINQSVSVVLIAKFVEFVPGGYRFHDEIQNTWFNLSSDDVWLLA